MSTIARERRALQRILDEARQHVADLTAMIAVHPSEPLFALRRTASSYVTDTVSALRRHTELFDDEEKTPVRPPSRSDMQAVRANVEGFTAERVTQILEQGKAAPKRGI